MSDLFRRGGVVFVAIAAVALPAVAQAQSEPPARVGRLAFTQGTVSFHDPQQEGWTQAITNTPLTSGDAIWTEPNAHSEVSFGGTRIRMDGATQLDMLDVDDSQTRLQLDQGRVDVRSFAMDANQPYSVLTPRGTVSVLQQGDYYVEAGSQQDPTRLGVRTGTAEFQALNGQTVPVHPGEVAEILGDPNDPQIRIVNTAPPAPAAYWAVRDRQVVYDQPPQYLTASLTGYEDLNAYGAWTNDPGYGEVWYPRAAPVGWEPYRTGRWIYQAPWGWTWVDEQPWGFAPYHYGRWAHIGSRWGWVPPERDVRPVYAPALVAFVGGVELAAVLGNRATAPVGWFPLGPREAYVPPYATNQDYYMRLNRGARVQDDVLRERWDAAQHREAFTAGERAGERRALMNQRFATVVPAATFVRSQPVTRAALQVAPERLATTPVAAIAAPPAPTARLAAAPAGQQAEPRTQQAPASNLPVARTALAEMPTLARPTAAEKPAIPQAPGPKLAATQPTAPTSDPSKHAPPQLAPRQGAAPPVLHGAVTPLPAQPGKPGEPPRTTQPQPAEPPKGQTASHPNQPSAPVEPPKPSASPQAQPHPVEPPKPQATTSPGQHPAPVEAPKLPPAQPQHAEQPTQPPHAAPQAPASEAQPQHTAPAQQHPTPQHEGQVQPPHVTPPPASQVPAPPPQPQHVQAPAPQPQHAAPPPPQPQSQPQHVQAPPPQPQHAAPPPPQPQPQPQHVQAPPPQPQPQPQHVQAPPPQPQPQPQHVQAPPPQPQPQHVQSPPPPQQPHPAPQQAQVPQPQPQQQQQGHQNQKDEKK
jgi:hypothetical protein